MISVAAAWHSANVVRTREKLAFFLGVMSLLFTALMFGMAPESVVTVHYQSRGRSKLNTSVK